MPDEVKLSVNGAEFAGWQGLTITRELDSVADGFSLSAPFDSADVVVRAAFKPFGYQSAVVKIDDEVVLTGRVESVSADVSAGSRELNVQGRSLTGSLVDCSVDIGRYQFDGLALSTIARQVCNPFGVSVVALNDTNPIAEARAEPGQTAFEFLRSLAEDYSLLLTCDSQGRFVIKRLATGGRPVASLVEGQGDVVSVSGSYDGTQRWSRYKVLAQQDGASSITGAADDSGVSLYRPKIESGGKGNASEVTTAARWRRALALAGSIGVTVNVASWRTPGGALWAPGQLVTLRAPGAFVTKDSSFVVAGATLSLDEKSGRQTALRLVMPAAYSGDMPSGGYPWE